MVFKLRIAARYENFDLLLQKISIKKVNFLPINAIFSNKTKLIL